MWVHKPGGSAETQDWWSQHAEFETNCQNEDLHPTRAEFDDLFRVFCAKYTSLRTLPDREVENKEARKSFSTPAHPTGPESY
jgi:hypothetical protein